MKKIALIPIIIVPLLLILLPKILPTEAEREAKKAKHLADRNPLEQQLVGKWNHSDMPAGMQNNRNYHLLSADASYSYTGSDPSKIFSGTWAASPQDSILHIRRPNENASFKILKISPNQISLQKIDNPQFITNLEWHRHP